jgi:PAS domain S-box-containing protein
LAPYGRDSAVARSLLAACNIEGVRAASIAELAASLHAEIGLVVATEEAFQKADLTPLVTWLRGQPSWSDLPMVVLTYSGESRGSSDTAWLSDQLGNVTLLERPFRPATFASVVSAALKARHRQYDARARMAELAESQERLRTALTAGHLGSWELDIASMELTASAACRAAFGRSEEQSFSYADLIASIHHEDVERTLRALEATISTGADYAVEFRNIWPDGSIHWLEIHGRRTDSGDGRTRQLVGVSAEITGRKNYEQQLLQMNESLEQRVRERTGALEIAHARAIEEARQRQSAEAQLLQAQKVEAIGKLTGGVAHDFNNLLTAVLGNLELLRRHKAGDAKAIRLIDGALEGARRGASLTQRLLAFARHQELLVEATDIGSLMLGLEDLLRQSVGPTIELAIEVPAEPLYATVDVNQIELAVLNLVVNARDAMSDGGFIKVRVTPVLPLEYGDLPPGGGYVSICVEDNGKGMNADTLRRSIEPFFSTKGVGKGTGLGLSMIHGLALQLGGALRIESTPGKGTIARLLVPAAAPAEKHEESAPEQVANAAPSVVLVVDDDALIAMSTVAMVEDLGHQTIEAYSGPEALEILRSERRIDLMITDFSMPKMSGAELVAAAKDLRPNLRIILASGYAELPNNVQLDVTRLPKPFDQRQLATQVNMALAPATAH